MRILAIARLNGELGRLEDVRRLAQEESPELVLFAGGMLAQGQPSGEESLYSVHRVLHTLARLPCPVAVVPGELDAPERHVLPIATAQEWTERHLHCVHGMSTSVHDLTVAGFGGQVTERERETETALRYPGWEVRYRLAFLSDMEQALVMVFHHPPARMHELDLVDGRHVGSQAVTEMLGTWRPRVAVVAGERPGREVYGSTVVVSPGRLDRGEYAVFDTSHGREARFGTTTPATQPQA